MWIQFNILIILSDLKWKWDLGSTFAASKLCGLNISWHKLAYLQTRLLCESYVTNGQACSVDWITSLVQRLNTVPTALESHSSCFFTLALPIFTTCAIFWKLFNQPWAFSSSFKIGILVYLRGIFLCECNKILYAFFFFIVPDIWQVFNKGQHPIQLFATSS